MDALLPRLPSRRTALVAGALVSGGFHLTLLFGFTGHPVPPVKVQPEKEFPIGCPFPPMEEDKPKSETKADKPEEAEAKVPDSRHATIPTPIETFNPEAVIADIPIEIGVAPGTYKFDGIPFSPNERGGGGKMQIFEPLDLDKQPELTARMAPPYPFDAKRDHIEGTVVVRFVVNAKGVVESASIGSSPHAAFNEPALAAVRKWRFKAGVKNGVAVASRMEIPLTFRLSE